MKIKILLSLIVSFIALSASASDCRSLMSDFIKKSERNELASLVHNDWSKSQKRQFFLDVKNMGFSQEDSVIITQALVTAEKSVTPKRIKEYLNFVKTLSEKNQKQALREIIYLDAKENRSSHIARFYKYEDAIKKKFTKTKMNSAKQARYRELYYGCRALRPNNVNANAAKDFKRFNLSLGLGTLAASYSFYNMDKEKNAEWYARLAYDVGVTIMFSYVGSAIQTKPTDTQIVKSLKGYFSGRIMGSVDILIYDPLFNDERKKAEARLAEIKKDPNYKAQIDRLIVEYQKRGVYRKFKDALIQRLKMLPSLSLGVEGNSVDTNSVDWNNLSPADLDRPEVQEVLVHAAMAQVYQESKGEWIETSNIGLDRYAYNSVYYAAMIPKSIVQNYITYQMLCMGQDNAKVAFTKAVLFNVTASFLTNQVLFSFREKAINQ